MPIVNRIADLHGEITAWRRDIHAHPELLYDVHRTAAVVADKLKSFGCDQVVTGIGRTGVVGVIRGSKGGDGWPGHRLARRHGCAADRGGERPSLQIDGTRQDACLRPRRAYRHAARRRALSHRDAQLRRHRGGDLPAGRGGRRGRQGDGAGWFDGALPHRGSLRHAQLSRASDRRIRAAAGSADGGGRPHHDRDRRPRRARGAPPYLYRHGAGGRADRQSDPIDRFAQRRSAARRSDLDLRVPGRDDRQCDSADGAFCAARRAA